MQTDIEIAISDGSRVIREVHLEPQKTFSAGEVMIRLEPGAFDGLSNQDCITVNVRMRHRRPEDLIKLLMVLNALVNSRDNLCRNAPCKTDFSIELPYLPYSRQDRVVTPGDPVGPEIVFNMIRSACFPYTCGVTTYDVHSDASAKHANLNGVGFYNQSKASIIQPNLLNPGMVLVSPDKGASNEGIRLATSFGMQFARFDKIRDAQTGQVKGMQLVEGLEFINGSPCLIVDDICDGGRTFTECARILRELGALGVDLYVTHGIFSAGLMPFRGLIDNIYTTNTFSDTITEDVKQSPDDRTRLMVFNVIKRGEFL